MKSIKVLVFLFLFLLTGCNMGQMKNDLDYRTPNGECKYCIKWNNETNTCEEIEYGVCM